MSEGGEARNHEADREISKNAPLRERIADELAHNDECGSGPVSWQEYLADADAILRIVGERSPQGEDHEAGIEAGMQAFGFKPDNARDETLLRQAIAAYLSRCPSPERDTEKHDERAVEALAKIEIALRAVYSEDGIEGTDSDVDEAIGACFMALAEFSVDGQEQET